jgi:hypothetical protein
MVAYTVSVPIPADFAGKPATLYLDLFDNLNPPDSLGWANNIEVVPEPSFLPLGLLATTSLLLFRRPKRFSRTERDG